ncbi:MAG: hypothetical protein QF723_00245 [Phycisphaerales bacterium]|mgnify:FL=1|jgi:hypothetical protein|nr:hypothetical protein [Phycisphaerales bacterium]MDP6310685.1 hypothetical protein [Phycisphaerales bacterium]MDP7087155.1 hypothetical protein [Phycisphaerales bacterium]MDP7188616.1 hypothetical protein [Phycisphaerales bacterium]MDP7520605.1 hypothetical protein [Phycisphaerales bacterium]|tara:strand:- start:1387 stop:1656 length:270 start_codon:yes stop_codon:yes gene_type:complete
MRVDLTIGGCGEGNGESFSVKDDPALIAEGWERRQLADPSRAKEAIELYESLGFEVLAKELEDSDFGEECKTCAVAGCQGYVMIYTRRG